MVDVLISNHIRYLGAEKQRMYYRRTLRPGSSGGTDGPEDGRLI